MLKSSAIPASLPRFHHILPLANKHGCLRLTLRRGTPGFFTLWTCKEAYVKALGRGLSKSLNSFEVSLADGGKPRILSDSEDNAHLNSWRLLLFEPRRNVLGCVAVDIASTLVELRDYDSGVLLQRIV